MQTTTATNAALMLSPVEAKILAALDGPPLYGKEVARKLSMVYSSTLKVLLENLVNRRVLRHVHGSGYSVREGVWA